MNPDPVMVTRVSGDPATVEVGVIEVMVGMGFNIGGGIGGEVAAPPQPVSAPLQESRSATEFLLCRPVSWPLSME